MSTEVETSLNLMKLDEILTTPLHYAQDDGIRMRSSRLRYAPLRMTLCWLEDVKADEILRLRYASLRMTFCWLDDAKSDEILTTSLRSAQDDILMRCLHFGRHDEQGLDPYDSVALRSG